MEEVAKKEKKSGGQDRSFKSFYCAACGQLSSSNYSLDPSLPSTRVCSESCAYKYLSANILTVSNPVNPSQPTPTSLSTVEAFSERVVIAPWADELMLKGLGILAMVVRAIGSEAEGTEGEEGKEKGIFKVLWVKDSEVRTKMILDLFAKGNSLKVKDEGDVGGQEGLLFVKPPPFFSLLRGLTTAFDRVLGSANSVHNFKSRYGSHKSESHKIGKASMQVLSLELPSKDFAEFTIYLTDQRKLVFPIPLSTATYTAGRVSSLYPEITRLTGWADFHLINHTTRTRIAPSTTFSTLFDGPKLISPIFLSPVLPSPVHQGRYDIVQLSIQTKRDCPGVGKGGVKIVCHLSVSLQARLEWVLAQIEEYINSTHDVSTHRCLVFSKSRHSTIHDLIKNFDEFMSKEEYNIESLAEIEFKAEKKANIGSNFVLNSQVQYNTNMDDSILSDFTIQKPDSDNNSRQKDYEVSSTVQTAPLPTNIATTASQPHYKLPSKSVLTAILPQSILSLSTSSGDIDKDIDELFPDLDSNTLMVSLHGQHKKYLAQTLLAKGPGEGYKLIGLGIEKCGTSDCFVPRTPIGSLSDTLPQMWSPNVGMTTVQDLTSQLGFVDYLLFQK